MKTSELTGPALDLAVAKAKGKKPSIERNLIWTRGKSTPYALFQPSKDWAQGGPIIEREGITIAPHSTHNGVIKEWKAGRDWPMSHSPYHFGTTPLIAAMRCYVASVLGDEVELPSVVEKIGL